MEREGKPQAHPVAVKTLVFVSLMPGCFMDSKEQRNPKEI